MFVFELMFVVFDVPLEALGKAVFARIRRHSSVPVFASVVFVGCEPVKMSKKPGGVPALHRVVTELTAAFWAVGDICMISPISKVSVASLPGCPNAGSTGSWEFQA